MPDHPTDKSKDDKSRRKPAAPPAHSLQQDPAEGSREVVDRELRRRSSGEDGDEAADGTGGEGGPDPIRTIDKTAGLP